MDAQTQPGPHHPGTLGGFLRRGAVVIVAFLVLGAAAGLGATALMHKKYTAAASVLVSATGVDDSTQAANGRTSGVINLDTEAQLVTSAGVASRAHKLEPQMPGSTTRELVKNVAITVPANTTVLKIAYTANTPGTAQASANAFADAYLADRKATASASLSQQIDNSEASVTSLTKNLRDLAGAESALPKNSRQRIFDDAQRSLLTSQISTINQQLISLRSTQITPGRVLTPAALPHAPSSPSRVLNLASGLAIGLVLGLLVAWLRNTHRRRVRRPSDLEHGVDVPTVAEVLALDTSIPVVLRSPAGEVYRRLSILTMAAIKGSGTIVVSAAGSSRSDSAVAANLAATLTAGGTSVCLLRITDQPEDSVSILVDDAVEVVTVDRAEAVRLKVGGSSTREALVSLRGDRDVLIIDTPSPTHTADAQTLAVLADAVLVVVDSGMHMKTVHAAIDAFDEVAAPMLGLVLVHTEKRPANKTESAGTAKVRVRPDTAGADASEKGSSSQRSRRGEQAHASTLVEPGGENQTDKGRQATAHAQRND